MEPDTKILNLIQRYLALFREIRYGDTHIKYKYPGKGERRRDHKNHEVYTRSEKRKGSMLKLRGVGGRRVCICCRSLERPNSQAYQIKFFIFFFHCDIIYNKNPHSYQIRACLSRSPPPLPHPFLPSPHTGPKTPL